MSSQLLFFFLLDCGPGEWTTIGEYSYNLSAKTATWNDARLQCQSIDASQAKITTVSFMKNLLKSSVSTNYWIGGHSPPGRANLQSGWRWDDDSPFSFSSVEWGTFGADGGDGPTSGWSSSQDNCLVWANMEFGDGSCSNQFKYICQKKCKKNTANLQTGFVGRFEKKSRKIWQKFTSFLSRIRKAILCYVLHMHPLHFQFLVLTSYLFSTIHMVTTLNVILLLQYNNNFSCFYPIS